MKRKNTFVAISVTLLLTFIVFLTACYLREEEKWYNEGVKYTNYHEYGKALECINKAINLKPDFAMAYALRGHVYSELVRYEEAIEDYTKAISLDPNSPDFYYNRAHVYTELEDYDAAILDLTESIKRAPDHANSFYLRGYSYYKIDRIEEALEDYTKACELGDRYSCDDLKKLKKEMIRLQK